ncbi:hypothetical protein GEM_5771 [Burkholderia cepacia GG4]|uniref:O-methyltransferase n=1 Tax=Burkholderia cepacia GG4 TaxID=1009846 RepID=A0A9W3PCY1_BURCE|nr:hypothetical protein GEM_5771 [Burkholderia cepacia GG4]
MRVLALAAALRDNGGGRLVTSEFETWKIARARANLTAAGLADLVEIREGDAWSTLAADLPDTVDLLVLEGAKALDPEILARVEPRLRPGAFVVADNAEYSPDYLASARAPRNGYLSVPIGGDVELSMRIGRAAQCAKRVQRTASRPICAAGRAGGLGITGGSRRSRR